MSLWFWLFCLETALPLFYGMASRDANIRWHGRCFPGHTHQHPSLLPPSWASPSGSTALGGGAGSLALSSFHGCQESHEGGHAGSCRVKTSAGDLFPPAGPLYQSTEGTVGKPPEETLERASGSSFCPGGLDFFPTCSAKSQQLI